MHKAKRGHIPGALAVYMENKKKEAKKPKSITAQENLHILFRCQALSEMHQEKLDPQ